MSSRARGLVFFLLLLFVVAGAILIAEGRVEQRREAGAKQFQRLVGGLGCGPAVDLSDCVSALDPRLESTCSWGHEPIPGGTCFCTWHTGAPLCSPPRDGGSSPEESADASPP